MNFRVKHKLCQNKKMEENISPKCRLRQVYFPISVQKSTNNPFWSPKGNLPVFRHNGIVLNDFPAVVKHLKSCNYSADYNLTNKQVKHWNKVFRGEGEVKERWDIKSVCAGEGGGWVIGANTKFYFFLSIYWDKIVYFILF